MKKITELTQVRFRIVRDKDADGNIVRSKEEYTAKRPVKTVGGWTRFGHYLIDAIILGAIGFVLGYSFPQAAKIFTFESGTSSIGYNYTFDLIGWVITVLFYLGFELATQQTPGKMITNTIVVDEYGNKPTAGKIVGRSFARLIPFEAFSCIGEHSHGWHDKFSKTWTLPKEELKTLKKLQREQSDTYVADDNLETLD